MKTILLGDIGNQLGIASAEAKIRDLKSRQRQAKTLKDLQIKKLEDELAKQKLAIQALTRFLIVKKMINKDELDDFIKEVDAEDGVVDGKMDLLKNSERLIFPNTPKRTGKKPVFKID